MSYKAFISSTAEDVDLARDLASRLQSAGIDVNPLDKTVAPESFSGKITRDLSQADEIFIILTNESVNNSNLMFEMGAATSLRKRVTPVVVGLKPNEVPSLIKNLHYIQYPDLGSYIASLEKRLKVAS